MDLHPENRGVAAFHANWTGWRCLRELLCDLGADLTSMAGANDGDLVDAATASDWARRLRGVLASGDLVEVLVPDDFSAGGERSHLRTTAGQLARPVLAPAAGSPAALRFLCERAHLHEDTYLEARAVVGFGGPGRVQPPDPSLVEWVAEAAAFFESSGGFRQF